MLGSFLGAFAQFGSVWGRFGGVQNRIYCIMRATVVRDGAKGLNGKGNYNFTEKKNHCR